jgi:hypothetical protein
MLLWAVGPNWGDESGVWFTLEDPSKVNSKNPPNWIGGFFPGQHSLHQFVNRWDIDVFYVLEPLYVSFVSSSSLLTEENSFLLFEDDESFSLEYSNSNHDFRVFEPRIKETVLIDHNRLIITEVLFNHSLLAGSISFNTNRLNVDVVLNEPSVATFANVVHANLNVNINYFNHDIETFVSVDSQKLVVSSILFSPAIVAGAVLVDADNLLIQTFFYQHSLYGVGTVRPDENIDSGGFSGSWFDVNQPTSSPNDSSFISTKNDEDTIVFGLTNMPSGFSSMKEVKILLRIRRIGDSNRNIYAQILDQFDDPLTSEKVVTQVGVSDSNFTTVSAEFNDIVGANSAVWNEAKLVLRVD